MISESYDFRKLYMISDSHDFRKLLFQKATISEGYDFR